MADGGWVVLGAAIGTLGSVLTTWLNVHLSQKNPDEKYDAAVSGLLKSMLQQGDKWRKIGTLANVAGLSISDAKEYLILLGARGSETDGSLWGLVSRNPISPHEV